MQQTTIIKKNINAPVILPECPTLTTTNRPEKGARYMTTIRNIVEEMRQGAAYCEYWQRDWSWSENNIATLWDSLFKGHPIGLFTFWEQ